MHQDGSLPRARRDGLLEETVGEELLLYDQESHTAHCLSPTAACVWRHCDGERDVSELAELAGASKDLVADALYELREKDLLDVEQAPMQSTIPGESRREVIGRVARYGAAAAAGSLIVSATAATPAMASSGEVVTCKTGSTQNCCVCEKAGGGEECTNKTESECTKYCTEGGRKFKGWTEKAECK
ncbi:MAG: PqqD family protein [Solirubrobacteraceae bacterium]